jgi:iron complex transport system substrate-binding protein
MKKIALILLITALLCGCTKPLLEKERKIVDMAGREISIPLEVKRVVVLSSEAMSLMRALKVDVGIAGATHYAFENPLITKIYDMHNVTNVGPGSKPNVEAIISLNPDLVIAYYCGESTRYGYEIPVEDVKKLESAGIPVVGICMAVTKAADFEDYNRQIRMIGEIFGKEREAEELIQHLEDIRNEISRLVGEIPFEKRVRVVYTWSEQNRIAGNSTITHAIIEMAGGINIGRNISRPYATVNQEFIVDSNPDVWIIWRNARYGKDDLLSNLAFSNVEAVKKGRIYKELEILFSSWEPIIAHMLVLWHAKTYYPDLQVDYEGFANELFEIYYGIKYPEVSK